MFNLYIPYIDYRKETSMMAFLSASSVFLMHFLSASMFDDIILK